MFKITSRFYIIYGDGKPIYVGYTNRTVKQRFSEHCKDKDFSGYDRVYVKELVDEKLSFNFTWDYEQTCNNAGCVSKRESYLVSKYGTQDTSYQKAIGGGQTWATEKYFVLTNRDNPKFKGMKPSDVKKLVLSIKVEQVWLHTFISRIQPLEQVWLHTFISHIQPIEQVWLSCFIHDIKPLEQVWVSCFISNIKPLEQVWLRRFISNIKPLEQVWLHTFISRIQPLEQVWLSSFIFCIKPIEQVWLSNFISRIKPLEQVWLSNFISNIQPREQVWLSSFISNIIH